MNEIWVWNTVELILTGKTEVLAEKSFRLPFCPLGRIDP